MTTEQAIKLLHRLQDEQFDGIHGDERREALDMAVRALSGDGDTISRKMAIDAIEEMQMPIMRSGSPIDQSVFTGMGRALQAIKALPSAQTVNYGSTKSDSSSQLKLNNDLISRQQAIDALDGFRCGTKAAWKVIEDLPSAQPRWIPCNERLPKYPFRVQIQLDNGWIITGYYSEEHWYTVPHCGGFLRNDEVEAWRELPKSYDGGDAK